LRGGWLVEKRGEKKKNPTGVLGGLALWAPPVQCGRLWILLQNNTQAQIMWTHATCNYWYINV
jgi:hypothetical protein